MIFNWLFGRKKGPTPPPDHDLAFQDGDAVLSFRFADMQAVYACRENPAPEAYEIRRNKAEGWMLRPEDGENWQSLARRFPVYADRADEIDKAFETFLLNVFATPD